MRILIILIIFLLFLVSCSSIYNLSSYKPVLAKEGDCFDRACQIKTILRNKGYETQFVIGIDKDERIGHAWIRYKKDGKWYDIDNFDEMSVERVKYMPNNK